MLKSLKELSYDYFYDNCDHLIIYASVNTDIINKLLILNINLQIISDGIEIKLIFHNDNYLDEMIFNEIILILQKNNFTTVELI